MRRFSILGLMGLVVLVAVAIAALRYADEVWGGAMLLLACAAFGTAVLGATLLAGRARAWWLGFAVFEGGYLLLTIVPGLADSVGAKLPTSQALAAVHARVVGPERIFQVVTSPTRTVTRYYADTLVAEDVEGLGPVGLSVAPTTSTVRFATTAAGPEAASTRWKSALPGAANYGPFLRVGHALFALLAGLLGAGISRRFDAKRAAAPAAGGGTGQSGNDPAPAAHYLG